MASPTAAYVSRPDSVIHSHLFGDIPGDRDSELFLPAGLPGFESEHFLLPVEVPVRRPLVFLQSTASPEVCFVCLPVSCIVSDFSIQLSEDDRAELGIDDSGALVSGIDVLCLALLLPCENSVKANLDAPLVINLRNNRCAQVLQDGGYGARYLTSDGNWQPLC